MSDLSGWKDPISVPFRPLNKGILLDETSLVVPTGGLLDCANYHVSKKGPKRRGGLLSAIGTDVAPYPPMRGLISFFQADGTQIDVAVDSKFVYEVTLGSGLTGVYDTYTTGTCSTAAAVVTGSGTSWSGEAQPGDIIVLDANGSGDGPVEAEVLTVDSDTQLTLTAAPTGTFGGGTDYELRKAFGASAPHMVDWALADNKVIFVDGVRFPRSYDGTTYGVYDAGITVIPYAVCHHLDRVWFGYINDAGTYHRQRLMWTETTDKTSLTAYFLDKPYTPGYIRRMLPSGPYLVVYLNDAVYAGVKTVIAGDALPLSLERLDTAGTGLVGSRAVCPWIGGHFAVLDDNIYWIGMGATTPTAVGTQVLSRTIETCNNPHLIYAAMDVRNGRAVFGFPTNSEEISALWSFDLKSNSWSYDEIPCSMVAGGTPSPQAGGTTWDDLTGTWDTITVPTWDAFGGEETSFKEFYIGFADGLAYLSDSATGDLGTSPIPCRLETPDWDGDSPDSDKTFLRVGLKIDRVLSADLSFSVQGSTNMGASWEDLGTLTIEVGKNEGFANMMMTGSHVRFLFQSSTVVEQYVVTEYVLRVVGRGIEIDVGD